MTASTGMRWVVIAAALVLTGCPVSLKRCAASAECGDGFRCEQEVCVSTSDAGTGGGTAGVGGGDAAGGGTGGGGVDLCLGVTCTSATQCASGACVARYSSLTLTGPARTGAGYADVAARLTLATGRTPQDPGVLPLEGLSPDGGKTTQLLIRADAGFYAATVLFPGDGTWKWTTAFADAGLSAQVTIGVDRTAPVFSLLVPPAPARLDTATLTEVDTQAIGAWRRDEKMTLRVLSSAPDVEPSTILARLEGTDGGKVGFSGATACADAGACWEIEVDFAAPPMNAYRAAFALGLTGADDLGNLSAVVDGGRPMVTRWKWSRALPDAGAIVVPTLDELGNLYISNTIAKVVESYTAGGAVRWSLAGQEYGFLPMLGTPQGGAPAVIWLSNPTQRTAFSSVDAGAPLGWTQTSNMTATGFPSLGVTITGNEPVARETAFAVVADPGRRLLAYRLNAPVPEISLNNDRLDPSWSAITQGKFWVREQDAGIVSMAVVDAGVLSPVGPGIPSLNSPGPDGFVATKQRLVRAFGQPPGLAVFNLTDGGLEWSSLRPDAGFGDTSFPPLVGAGDVLWSVYFGSPNGLCRVAAGSQSWSCLPLSLTALGPSLGEGGLLYVATVNGLEVRRQSDFGLQWGAAPGEAPLLSTMIDCSRDLAGNKLAGRPGVLYGEGDLTAYRLFAVIVDSRGIDATAPWPVVRHDPRNTGNADTSLTPFSCP